MSKTAAVVADLATDSELALSDCMERSASTQKCCGDNPDKPCCGRCKDCSCARLPKRDSSEDVTNNVKLPKKRKVKFPR